MGENSAYYNSLNQGRRNATNAVKDLLPQYAKGFIDECLLEHQVNTAYSYAHDILFFYQYLHERNPLCQKLEIKDISLDIIGKLEPQDINEYQNYIAEGHKPDKKGVTAPAKEKTIARKMASLRNFFKYLIKFDYIKTDPTLKAAKRVKEIEKKQINRLDKDQVKQLMDAVSEVDLQSHHSKVLSEQTAKRDLAIVTLLLHTGIRVSECAGIDVDDVNFTTNTIKIVRKGGGSDELFINEIVRNTLRDYLYNERPALLQDDTDETALFISLKHRRLSVRSIQYMVGKYGKDIGFDKKLTPHKLRRTFGTSLYNKSGDIYMVADVLGHKDVNTTIKHYADIEEEHKRKAAQLDIYDMNDEEND